MQWQIKETITMWSLGVHFASDRPNPSSKRYSNQHAKAEHPEKLIKDTLTNHMEGSEWRRISSSLKFPRVASLWRVRRGREINRTRHVGRRRQASGDKSPPIERRIRSRAWIPAGIGQRDQGSRSDKGGKTKQTKTKGRKAEGSSKKEQEEDETMTRRGRGSSGAWN